MMAWASILTVVAAVIAFFASDLSSFLTGAAELTAVLALFALVCATEALD